MIIKYLALWTNRRTRSKCSKLQARTTWAVVLRSAPRSWTPPCPPISTSMEATKSMRGSRSVETLTTWRTPRPGVIRRLKALLSRANAPWKWNPSIGRHPSSWRISKPSRSKPMMSKRAVDSSPSGKLLSGMSKEKCALKMALFIYSKRLKMDTSLTMHLVWVISSKFLLIDNNPKFVSYLTSTHIWSPRIMAWKNTTKWYITSVKNLIN